MRAQEHHGLAKGLKHVASHAAVTLLAVGVAFSIPAAAQYVLFQWWPKVQDNSQLLLITEIVCAAALVLLFNISRFAWSARRAAKINHLAALVDARVGRERGRGGSTALYDQIPAARDALVMLVTGGELFGGKNAGLIRALESCREIRVLLLDPDSEGACTRAHGSDDPERTLEAHRQELRQCIAYLAKLRAAGKQVALKFYGHAPFWRLVLLGDHVWVQYCHEGDEVETSPEYVFALRQDNPSQGFFAPFHVYFLNQWGDPLNPSYNFAGDELIYGGESTDGRRYFTAATTWRERRNGQFSAGAGKSALRPAAG